jgi:hypothetical protein
MAPEKNSEIRIAMLKTVFMSGSYNKNGADADKKTASNVILSTFLFLQVFGSDWQAKRNITAEIVVFMSRKRFNKIRFRRRKNP